MPMSRPVRRTRRKTVFTLVTVLFTSERDTNALYLQINPTGTRSQVDSTRVDPSCLARYCTGGDAGTVGGGAPKKVLDEAQATGNARTVPAEMLTFDQMNAMVANGRNVVMPSQLRQVFCAEAVWLVRQQDDLRVLARHFVQVGDRVPFMAAGEDVEAAADLEEIVYVGVGPHAH